MLKGLALAICAAVTTPMLYFMWSSVQRRSIRTEAELDETIEQSFPASDPPAHRTVTSAG